MNKQPTKTQIKTLWEWCGFKFIQPIESGAVDVIYPDGSMCLSPSILALPHLDLNNLFKYALPKLQWFIVNIEHIEVSCEFYVTLTDFYLAQPCKEYKSKHKDPAIALFWAIWQIITLNKESKTRN